MAYGFSWGYATSYTQLRDLLASKMADAGWVEIGSTMIFKSPVADEKGNFAYIHVTDDGVSKPQLRTSIYLDDAGTDLARPIGRVTEVNNWNKLWHFYIFDKWVYCFETDLGNDVDAFMGAGLFRPLPNSIMWDFPYWVYAGNGTERGGWIGTSGVPNLSGRVKYADGANYYAAPGVGLASSVHSASSIVQPAVRDQAQFGGGLLIQPSLLWTQVGSYAILGSIYNAIIVSGIGWETQGTDVPCGTRVTYGGTRVYQVPGRPNCHASGNASGAYAAFQVDGF